MPTKTAADKRERLNFPVELKSLDGMQGTFEGYLSVFDNEDLNGDICEKGCFSKTLIEAKAAQSRSKSPFLYPLLWMHDEDNPIGGFTDMYEDNKGLYVKGMCDLDTEQGRRAFSGMVKGYMAQLSIGYNTVKSVRDSKGVRHLTEVRLWEGSAITTGYAANPSANVLRTKRSENGMRDVKGVSGKMTWPIGERDRAWDSGAAHNRLVAWATDDDGTLDQAKFKSVHFWFDGSAPDKITSYKLAFCDVVDGNVTAIPRAIEACTGAHGVDATGGPSSAEKASIKKKISSYYNRMAKQFDDDSMMAPWDQQKYAAIALLERKGLGGLQSLTYCLSRIDELGYSMDMYLEMLGSATGLDLDPDEGEEGEGKSVLGDIERKDADVQPAVKILLDNMPGLSDALVQMGQAFQMLDDATDMVLGMVGMTPCEDGYGVMAVTGTPDVKVGRRMSAATKAVIQRVMDGMMEHKEALSELVGSDTSESDSGTEGASVRRRVNVHKQPELSATTADDTSTVETEPGAISDTTLDDLSAIMLDAQLRSARFSVTQNR